MITTDNTTLTIFSKITTLISTSVISSLVSSKRLLSTHTGRKTGTKNVLTLAVVLTVSLVITRLYYCNLLCELPAYVFLNCIFSKTMPLKLFFFSSFCSCLDRLLVVERYNFKLMWLVTGIFTTGQPVYSYDLLSIQNPYDSLNPWQSGCQLHQPISSNLFAYRFFPILPLTYGTPFHPTFVHQLRWWIFVDY